MNKTKKEQEGNLYDKLFKENAEALFIPLIEKHLPAKIKKSKNLTPKIHKTLEREVDFLFQLKLENGEFFLLHLEFQTQSDPEMGFRIIEYHGFLTRTYKMELKHIVIYLGSKKANMPQLDSKFLHNSFQLIELNSLDPNKFLSSQIPEELMLAILCKYPKHQTEQILTSIILKLKKTSKNKILFNKFVKQLLVISRLRQAESQTLKIVKNMPVLIDIEKDTLYRKGIEKGIVKGIERGIVKGIEQGRAKGIEQGRAKGIEQAKMEMVLEGYLNGVNIDTLAKMSKLSKLKIKSMLRQHNITIANQ